MHDFIRYRRVEFRLFVVLAALCVLLSLTTDTFLTFGNLSSLLNNNSVNLIWAVSPSFSVGVEALYGRHEVQDGQDADVTRLQASVKYDFVK